MTNNTKGYINGITSGMAYGLIPMFSIPVMSEGMDETNILFYRYLFGGLTMLVFLLIRKEDLRIGKKDLTCIAWIAVIYAFNALATLVCYRYVSSGIATALVYTDPIFCAIIGVTLLHEAFSIRVAISIVMASVGVMFLTGMFSELPALIGEAGGGAVRFSLLGLIWGLTSGLAYGIYIMLIPRTRVRNMPGAKFSFYLFLMSTVQLLIFNIVTKGEIQVPQTAWHWGNLILLGIIPTGLSNICVTAALKFINSTIVAILGAFEPITAMAVGVIVLGEPLSFSSLLGMILILLAVGILTVLPNLQKTKSIVG